jgi:hypothetical protein
VLHRLGHRIDVAGRTGDSLGEHSTGQIEDADRYIAAGPHQWAESGSNQDLRLFFDECEQAIPENLMANSGV